LEKLILVKLIVFFEVGLLELCVSDNHLLQRYATYKTARHITPGKCKFNHFSLVKKIIIIKRTVTVKCLLVLDYNLGPGSILTASILLLFEVRLLNPRSGDLSEELVTPQLVYKLFTFYKTRVVVSKKKKKLSLGSMVSHKAPVHKFEPYIFGTGKQLI
jgi:hypothetical protein